MPNEKSSRFHFLKKHKKIYFTIIILLIIGILIFKPSPPKPIEVQKVKKSEITESISSTGTITPKTSVDLNFLTSGKLIYLGAKKGDYVKAYQTIAVLDQRSLQKNLETSLRDYSLQRNTFENTQNDNANRTPNQALSDAMKRILQDNQYDLEKAVLSVELQQLTKENYILSSPIAGIITKADVSTTGANISAATTFTVADPGNLVFKIDVDEADIGQIRIGKKVTLILDSYPDETIPLQISNIDFSSHTSSSGGNVYTVEAIMPENIDTKYRIGMTGDADIVVNQKKDVLIISIASLDDNNNAYVKKGDNFIKTKVTTGIKSDTEIEITSGLKEGEEVAIQTDEVITLLNNKKKTFSFF
jgi:RND family efflux transporter MFP subunit